MIKVGRGWTDVMKKEPGVEWFTTSEVAEILGISRETVVKRLRGLTKKHRQKIVYWKKRYYMAPAVVDEIVKMEPKIPRRKEAPPGWWDTARAHLETGIPRSTISGAASRGEIRAVKVRSKFFLEPSSTLEFAKKKRLEKRKISEWVNITAVRRDVSQKTLQAWKRRGLLPYKKVGRSTLVHLPTVDKLIADGMVKHYRRERVPDGMVEVAEVAKRLGVSTMAIRKAARRNNLYYRTVPHGRGAKAFVDPAVVDYIPKQMPEYGWVCRKRAEKLYGSEVVKNCRNHARPMIKDGHYVVGYPIVALIQEAKRMGIQKRTVRKGEVGTRQTMEVAP